MFFSAVFLNHSDIELVPVMTSLLAMFHFVVNCQDIPSFAVNVKEITIHQVQEAGIEASHLYLGGLLRRCPVNHDTKELKGDIF